MKMKEIVSQRRKDKDIEHLPKSSDKSKARDDKKKSKGIDKSDPDLDDTERDPDMKLSHIAKRITHDFSGSGN